MNEPNASDSGSAPSHHLAAVWFADLVGYTALSETNEGDAIRAVSRFQAVVRAIVQTHGGRVVKFLGDGALAEFPSTEQAVRSADTLRADFLRVAEAEGLGASELRIGVHVGDVAATEDGDLYGDGVNVASRIQAAADPGEVWVSEDVRRQLRQRPELRFAARGEHALKGLRTPLELHAVGVGESAPTEAPSSAKSARGRTSAAGQESVNRWGRRRAVSLLGVGALIAVVALGASSWWKGRGAEAEPAAATLAVLPFENLSGDKGTDPFVLGLHDDLLTHLSQIDAINVISRTSVLGYRGTTKSVSEIADELGASVILEGGVQRSGDRIRMNVQLIDADTDEHLWAEQYDRTLTIENVFAIQAEIAERIASAMETTLTPEQRADLAEAPTENLEALDLYYQGVDAYRGRAGLVTGDARNAVHFLERATELDPDFAAAWAALAQARAWLIRTGMVSDTTDTRAALDRAAALAPDARETALAEGVYLYYARGDFAGAAVKFATLLRRQPDDAEALYWLALVLRRLGRWDEALDSMERAREADPRNSGIVGSLGVTLYHLRRYDEAEERLDEALVLSSSNDALSNKLTLLLWGRGDARAARGFLEVSARDLDPGGYALLDGLVALGERDYEGGLEALEGEFIPEDQKPNALFLQALLSRLAGRTELSAMMVDSLIAVSEGQITASREGGADPFGFQGQFTAFRGLAHAMAGRQPEAVRDGRRAVEMLPLSKDAIEGEIVLSQLAMIYALVGDRDAAFRTLETLVSVPSEMGVGRLRLDPTFDSLREDPRFDALIEKAEAAERSGTGTL